MLEALRSRGADGFANCARSSKRNRPHFGMLEHRRSRFSAKSSDEVNDAFGDTGIGQSADQIVG